MHKLCYNMSPNCSIDLGEFKYLMAYYDKICCHCFLEEKCICPLFNVVFLSIIKIRGKNLKGIWHNSGKNDILIDGEQFNPIAGIFVLTLAWHP